MFDGIQKVSFSNRKQNNLEQFIRIYNYTHMSGLLKDSNRFQTQNKLNPMEKHQQNNKGDDYIFKRYRYETNTILNSEAGRGRTLNHKDDEYHNQNKQNELQIYKQQLDEQMNHFDVVDFGQQQDQGEDQLESQEVGVYNSKQNESSRNQLDETSNHKDNFIDNFENDFKSEDKHSAQGSHQIRTFKKQPIRQDFDVQPMQLVDFDEQEEQISEGDQITQSEQITHGQIQFKQQTNRSSGNPYMKNDQNVFSHQTFERQLELQQSAHNFIKSKDNGTKNHIQQQKHFSAQHMGVLKYQVQKVSQTDNPFQGAIDYSQDQQLKGIKIHKMHNQQEIKVQILDKDLFVSSKIPPGIILKCKLKRSTGFFNIMSPEYDLYLQNGLKHLVSAKKNLFRNRELFQISTEISNFQTPIRTLMANVLHNTYWLVDSPRVIGKKKISYLDLLIDYEPIREQSPQARQMTVLCPPALKTYHIGLQYDIPSIDFHWFKKNIALQIHYRKVHPQINKTSDKNFELIDSDEEDEPTQQKPLKNNTVRMIPQNDQQTNQVLTKEMSHQLLSQNNKYHYLKMEKTSQNIFDVQIQHPLTPLQAMAIILTRFDAQLK